MQSWQLQDAKARLSEVLKEASFMAHKKLIRKSKPSFITFLRNSPLAKISLDLTRDTSKTREV